jgi:hypothetical protein
MKALYLLAPCEWGFHFQDDSFKETNYTHDLLTSSNSHINNQFTINGKRLTLLSPSIFISELIADEGFSMLSKNLLDLAQAFETFLLVSY